MKSWQIVGATTLGVAVVGIIAWRRKSTPLVATVHLSANVGMGAPNRRHDVIAVRRRLIALGFWWAAGSGDVDAALINALKLVSSILRGQHVVRGAGLVDRNAKWLVDPNAPRWMKMPASGPGFVNYEITDLLDHHDFGTSWLADTIRAAGKVYGSQCTPITINDVSLPQGGPTSDHKGHECGLACDLRLPRRDGSAGGITYKDPEYDRIAAAGQLRAFLAQPLTSRVLFNDPEFIAQGLCKRAQGHEHHIHVEIEPPVSHA